MQFFSKMNLEQLSCRKYSQKHYLCKHIMKGEKLQTTEERFLLSAMQHGDLKAYGVLFRRYYPILCAYATKFVELKDAEEIVQDVMLWLWENRETQTFETSLSQYLFKTVYHRAINQIVRHQSQLRADTLFYENMQEMLQDTDFYQLEELQRNSRSPASIPQNRRLPDTTGVETITDNIERLFAVNPAILFHSPFLIRLRSHFNIQCSPFYQFTMREMVCI